MNAIENGSIADETCDTLCRAAREKSLELGIDISFAVADADGLPRMFRRFGDALVLSTTLVPAKAHTAAVTRFSTGELAKCAAEGGSLFGINSSDPRIVFVAGASLRSGDGFGDFARLVLAGGAGEAFSRALRRRRVFSPRQSRFARGESLRGKGADGGGFPGKRLRGYRYCEQSSPPQMKMLNMVGYDIQEKYRKGSGLRNIDKTFTFKLWNAAR